MSVGLAVFGYGYWGPNLVRNLRAVPDARVVRVVEPDPARAEDARRAGLAVAADGAVVLGDPAVAAVVVATPAATHVPLARAALEAGKHVLVEKPLALTVADGEALVRLAERRGRVLMVGHTFLYNAAVRRLREYVAAGELGDVLYVASRRLNNGRVRQDVNALWNFAPHDVSILLYVLDDDPVEVSAQGLACLKGTVEDVVFATLRFPGGVGAHVHVSWLDPIKVRQMVVVGRRRMVVYDDVSRDRKLTLYDRASDLPTAESPRDFRDFAEFQQAVQRRGAVVVPEVPVPEPLGVQCAHFVECVRTGVRPLTDGAHALRVVRVLEAAQRSLAAGGAPERVR